MTSCRNQMILGFLDDNSFSCKRQKFTSKFVNLKKELEYLEGFYFSWIIKMSSISYMLYMVHRLMISEAEILSQPHYWFSIKVYHWLCLGHAPASGLIIISRGMGYFDWTAWVTYLSLRLGKQDDYNPIRGALDSFFKWKGMKRRKRLECIGRNSNVTRMYDFLKFWGLERTQQWPKSLKILLKCPLYSFIL